MSRSRVYQVTDAEFSSIIHDSKTFTQCLRELGLNHRGGSSSNLLKRRIKELGLSTEHFQAQTVGASVGNTIPLEGILVENSTYTNRTKLKKRLCKKGLLAYECSKCGISSWQGEELSLHLEHINGVNNDNRLENLCLLCPNCHSQTDTYAGRNIKNKYKADSKDIICRQCEVVFSAPEWSTQQFCSSKCSTESSRVATRPSKGTLYNLLTTTSFTEVGNIFSVSGNAVKKWCDYYDIPSKAKYYRDNHYQ